MSGFMNQSNDPSDISFSLRGSAIMEREADADLAAPVRLSNATVSEVAVSFAHRRRHLVAVTLHALATGAAMRAAAAAKRAVKPTTAAQFLKKIRKLGGEDAFAGQTIRDDTGVSKSGYDISENTRGVLSIGTAVAHGAASVMQAHQTRHRSHPHVVMIAALDLYMGAAPVSVTPTFPLSETDAAMGEELYGDEMHSVVWRMALECVKAREYALAEPLFVMQLLLENPDLFHALYLAPAPSSADEVVAHVVRVAAPAGAAEGGAHDELVNPGRLWGAYYASHYHRLDAAEYDAARRGCTAPTAATVAALLGLSNDDSAVQEYGCVSYSLAMEDGDQRPAIGPYVVNTERDVQRPLVEVAHAMRLCRKPLVDQRWHTTAAERMAVTRCHALNPPEALVAAARAATRRVMDVEVVEGFQEEPHTVALPAVLAALAGSRHACAAAGGRETESHLRYSASVHSNRLTARARLVKALSPDVYLKIYRKSTDHTNFYATVECGRLMALFNALRLKTHTVAAFGDGYAAEAAELSKLPYRRLELAGLSNRWRDATFNIERDTADEVASNNVQGDEHDACDPVLLHAIAAALGDGDKPPHRLCVSRDHRAALPMLRFCKFHPACRSGTGSRLSPHVTLPSALNAVFLGERVELAAGDYRDCLLTEVDGTMIDEVVVCPEGYMEAVLEDDPHSDQQRLEPAERDKFAKVVLAPARGRDEDAAVVTFSKCTFVTLRGIEVTAPTVAVVSVDSHECTLRHCVVTCEIPYRSESNAVVEELTNDVRAKPGACMRAIAARALPHQVRFVGYLLALGLFVFFALFCLFLTAGFTDAVANTWIIRCALSTALSALIIEPIAVSGFTALTVVSTVLNGAIGELRSFAPL
jgi:hypothetical protein